MLAKVLANINSLLMPFNYCGINTFADMGVVTMMNGSVSSDENKILMAWLKDKRKEKGHTMRTLSQIIGTPHSFVGKVENQERRLDIVEYIRYCRALDIDPIEGLKKIAQ